ncbi:MAG: glycoside hydrolase family 20 zincin-like fold domain-containing protein, partial [Armatimonadota bacterium]
PDGIQVDMTANLLRDIPAELEYACAYIASPTLIGNAGYADGAPFRIPSRLPKPGRSQQENRLCPDGFRSWEVVTQLGNIQCEVISSAKNVLFDARSDTQGWAKAFPVFWMGIGSPAAPLIHEKPLSHSLRLSVGPRPESAPIRPITLRPAKIRTRIFTPPAPVIIPTPKSQRIDTAPRKRIPCKTLALIGNLPPELKTRFVMLCRQAGISISAKSTARLLVGISSNAAAAHPEGYEINAVGKQIRLLGADVAGLRWGIETLFQLVSRGADGGVGIPETHIVDWPTLSFRGVHLFFGKTAPEFHGKLITRLFAPFKLNQMVIQCEQAKWPSAPDIAPSWAGTAMQLTEEARFATQHGITLTPLIQGYGHMEWLFGTASRRPFAEDPETPYALNFSNKQGVELVRGIMLDAAKAVPGAAFHIGLDEVTMRGRFPFSTKGKDFVTLFTDAVTYWQKSLLKAGRETWLWGDMLLHPSECAPSFGTAPSAADAKRLRAALPKDVTIFDWQYSALSKYPSLDLLKASGFTKRVACTWWDPANIKSLAAAASTTGALGALCTTWCGYESKESVLLGEERRQFVAMVHAAEHFWNGGTTQPAWDAGDIFNARYDGRSGAASTETDAYPVPLPKPIDRVDGRITPMKNYPIPTTGWQFTSAAPAVLGGILQRGSKAKSIRVELPRGSKRVWLVLGASHAAPAGSLVGEISIGFGTAQKSEALLYGRDIAAIDDAIACTAGPVVQQLTSVDGGNLLLRGRVVNIPAGAQLIELSGGTSGGALLMYALSVE